MKRFNEGEDIDDIDVDEDIEDIGVGNEEEDIDVEILNVFNALLLLLLFFKEEVEDIGENTNELFVF